MTMRRASERFDGRNTQGNVSGQDIVVRVQTVGLPEAYRHGMPFGTELKLSLPAAQTHLFDKETGVNLMA